MDKDSFITILDELVENLETTRGHINDAIEAVNSSIDTAYDLPDDIDVNTVFKESFTTKLLKDTDTTTKKLYDILNRIKDMDDKLYDTMEEVMRMEVYKDEWDD